MVFRDASEPSHPVAKEAVAVLTAVCVSVTDNIVFVVIDGEMAINLVVVADSIVDSVLICTEDR